MKSQSILPTAALLAALALAIPAFAKPVNKTITITNPAKVGKYDLKAGEYRLLIDGNKATIQQGKRLVAETAGRWEERDAKAYADSIVTDDHGQVLEVRFNGQKQVFVISQ
jgi:hypothetical protein